MKRKILVLVLLGMAFMIAFHQFLVWGVWFEAEDLHHETMMVSLVFAALLIGFLKIEGKPQGWGCFGS